MGDGPVPIALVMQLEAPLAHAGAEPSGDPVYGRVFNTLALNGVPAEGAVTVRYTETSGYYYPFGGRWSLRVPHYHLTGLPYGPLSPTTVIKPRLAHATCCPATPRSPIHSTTRVRVGSSREICR